ncbi:MAG: protein-disulfide reductase DsbD [Gammaproteobacteria bacterium]|nr:MAG: protein-disulfide reductase DsbD [Gammaproteobacteria bacterium]
MVAVFRIVFLLFVLTLFTSGAYAKANFFDSDNFPSGAGSDIYGDFLPPEQAFIFTVENLDQRQVKLSWTVAEGYYLYKDKFRFSNDSSIKVVDTAFSEAVMVDDPKFGKVPVFRNSAHIYLQLSDPVPEEGTTLRFSYQGCAEGGLCYPLMDGDYPLIYDDRLPEFDAEAFAVLKGKTAEAEQLEQKEQQATEISSDLLSQEVIISNLSGKSFALNIAVFLLAGVVSAFLGCSYPLIPIVSSLIAGQGEKLTPQRGAALSTVYVIAMALVLSIAGLIAATIGVNVTALLQNPYVLGGVSLVFVILAIAMFGKLDIAMPATVTNFFNHLSNKQKGGSYIGAAIMGAMSALIAGPCATPVLAGALIYIANTNNLLLGWSALFALGIGTGMPLILVGAGMGSFLPKAGEWMDLLKGFFGFVLLGLALWFLQQGGLPLRLVNLAWGLIFLGAAIYFVRNGMKHLKHMSIAVLLFLVFGAGSILGFAAAGFGGKSLFSPFTPPVESSFTYARSLDELQQRIAGEKPVVMYFTAEWCTVCRSLDANVISDPAVNESLKKWNPTKIDMTISGEFQKVLMEKYQVIGPPTFIMLDGNGNVAQRIVGNIDVEGLVERLDK